MKAYGIGTVLVIIGAVLFVALTVLGFSYPTSVICGVGLSLFGFGVQMWSAFSTKREFEEEMKLIDEHHRALMAQVENLPLEEAIALLLKNT